MCYNKNHMKGFGHTYLLTTGSSFGYHKAISCSKKYKNSAQVVVFLLVFIGESINRIF